MNTTAAITVKLITNASQDHLFRFFSRSRRRPLSTHARQTSSSSFVTLCDSSTSNPPTFGFREMIPSPLRTFLRASAESRIREQAGDSNDPGDHEQHEQAL